MAKQEKSGMPGWLRAGMNTQLPVWGLREGIQIGLWPYDIEGRNEGGPRGLFRVGYPIKEAGKTQGLVNFIAVEPIVKGERGFSELESSSRDSKPGKIFWSGSMDSTSEGLNPGALEQVSQTGTPPVAGTGIPNESDTINPPERLSVMIHVEAFRNGAKPIVEISFVSDRPGEVSFRITAAPDSAPMEYCVLTATMGNYMRLRRLYLRDHVVQPKNLWPNYAGNGFTPEAFFPAHLIPVRSSGDLIACATTDEIDPHAVLADPRAPGWRYRGSFPMTQYWRKPAGTWKEDLRLRVNGRRIYWAGQVPIPGGLAYENFDLVEPFTPGETLVFGLSRSLPEKLLSSSDLKSL